jgi:hypothetical protein
MIQKVIKGIFFHHQPPGEWNTEQQFLAGEKV